MSEGLYFHVTTICLLDLLFDWNSCVITSDENCLVESHMHLIFSSSSRCWRFVYWENFCASSGGIYILKCQWVCLGLGLITMNSACECKELRVNLKKWRLDVHKIKYGSSLSREDYSKCFRPLCDFLLGQSQDRSPSLAMSTLMFPRSWTLSIVDCLYTFYWAFRFKQSLDNINIADHMP